MATKFGFSDFESWLTTGGDDRSLILEETGANKYHIKPRPILSTQIFRGSCTGNPPTRTGYDAAKALYDDLLPHLHSHSHSHSQLRSKPQSSEELDAALRNIFEQQRRRLAEYLELPPGTEIILCPSGSDAEYIPIAIARALHPNKKIVSGITQLNEIGAGTAPASMGKYFSTYAPFLGRVRVPEDDHDDDDDDDDEDAYLEGYDGIEGVVIHARDKDGTAIDASEEMNIFTQTQLALNNYPIVHGVFGGKTGMRDGNMPPSLGKGDESMGVVDACQGRFTLKELEQWLGQDSIVLFTTSKFYQAPPFCGAVILPASIASKVSQCEPPKDMLGKNGLLAFVTDKELPSCMDGWKEHLSDEQRNNVGLALRWEAGLAAMEKISFLSDEERTMLTDEWANMVKTMVDDHPCLEAFCVERSIISIRMAKDGNSAGGNWLSMSEARDLFRWMSLDVSEAVPGASEEEKEALSVSGFIGQPVSVSEDYAIVRIALGVESLVAYSVDKDQTLGEDSLIVKKLGAISKYFSVLKESEL